MIRLKKYSNDFKNKYFEDLDLGHKDKKEYDYTEGFKNVFLLSEIDDFKKFIDFIVKSEFLSKSDNPYYEIIQKYIFLCDIRRRVVTKKRDIINYNVLKINDEDIHKINNDGALLSYFDYSQYITEDIRKTKEFEEKTISLMKKIQGMNDYLSERLNYSKVTTDIRKNIIEYQEIEACPYCNEHYIDLFITDDKKIKNDSELDHFFPKSAFPLFSVSLYNFIPSCKVCNQTYKSDNFMNIIYPYVEDFGDDARFDIDLNGEEISIELNVDCQDKNKEERINNSIDLFKLNERYSGHQFLLNDIFFKKSLFANSMVRNIYDMIHNYDESITKEELKMKLCGYSDIRDDNKYPMSKLYRDIFKKYMI